MNKLIAAWHRLPPKVQKWIKGLEVAVITGVVSAAFAVPAADFTSKAGWVKFIAEIVAVAGGCVRLYMTQSPLQNVLASSQTELEFTDGDRTLKKTQTDVLSGPDSASLKP